MCPEGEQRDGCGGRVLLVQSDQLVGNFELSFRQPQPELKPPILHVVRGRLERQLDLVAGGVGHLQVVQGDRFEVMPLSRLFRPECVQSLLNLTPLKMPAGLDHLFRWSRLAASQKEKGKRRRKAKGKSKKEKVKRRHKGTEAQRPERICHSPFAPSLHFCLLPFYFLLDLHSALRIPHCLNTSLRSGSDFCPLERAGPAGPS